MDLNISRQYHYQRMCKNIYCLGGCPQAWLAYQEDNWVWNNQHGMHGFGIFIAVVVFLMKV